MNINVATLNPNRQDIKIEKFLDMISEVFRKCEINEVQQKKLTDAFHLIKPFCVLRELKEKNKQVTVTKSILGVMMTFVQQETKNKVSFQLKRTALDQLNIFKKKYYEGLDIFYILLAGIANKHTIFSQILLQEKQVLEILQKISQQYYEKAKTIYEEDSVNWNYFYENIRNYFLQEELNEIFALLLFCLAQYLKDQQIILEKPKKTQEISHAEEDIQNENQSTGLSDTIQDIELKKLQNLIQTQWDKKQENSNVNSHKLYKNTEEEINQGVDKGVAVYLYTQLVNKIFQRIESQLTIENQLLYNQIGKVGQIFFLTYQRSSGGGLAELLRDQLCNIIEEQYLDFDGIQRMSNLEKMKNENEQLLQLNQTKLIFQNDSKLDDIKDDKNYYEVKLFQEEYAIGLPIKFQQLMRENSKNKIIQNFPDQNIESAIDLAFKMQVEIKKIKYYQYVFQENKDWQYKKYYKNAEQGTSN